MIRVRGPLETFQALLLAGAPAALDEPPPSEEAPVAVAAESKGVHRVK